MVCLWYGYYKGGWDDKVNGFFIYKSFLFEKWFICVVCFDGLIVLLKI